jgi:hypothetical protein
VALALTATETLNGGKVTAITARKGKVSKKVVVLGSVTVTIAAGQSKTVEVSLNATGKRLLAKHRKLKAQLTVRQSGKTVSSATVTLNAPQKMHKH